MDCFCAASAALVAAVFWKLLSVTVFELSVAVTEQVTSDPAGARLRSQLAELLVVVTEIER